MLAVIKTGGKQYLVEPGTRLTIEKLETAAGTTHAFGEVLLVAEPDGSKVSLGTPTVSGAKVSGKVVAQRRDKKIFMLKYKPKKRYRLRKGHRQHVTDVEVSSVA